MDAHRDTLVALSAGRHDSRVLTDPRGPMAIADDIAGGRIEAYAQAMLAPWLAEGGTVLWPDAPGWPQGLAALGPAAPLMLWVRGVVPVHPGSAVAFVGSRAGTAYGRRTTQELAGRAARLPRYVLSGGAAGIDGWAHEAALDAGGCTVVVAAGGAGRRYPREHEGLFRRAAKRGAVVWEFPPGVPLTKQGFLVRNRLIAAMSSTTVVVEAAMRSGALNTARTAADLGRLVLAVPGPVSSPTSQGCHTAIAEGWGAILLGADDLCGLLAPVPV